MNNPNPFVPKGSLLEQQSQRRSRLKLAVFCVLAVSVTGLVAMLIQGCKREQPAENPNPLVDTNMPALDLTNTPPADTNMTAQLPPPAAPTNPVAVPPALPPTPEVAVPSGTDYVVVQGDTLAKIAKAHGVSLKALEAANPGVDSKKLKIKQKLTIPGATKASEAGAAATAGTADTGSGETYVVRSGDNLSKIAKRHGVSLKSLRAANNMTTDHIKVGEKLKIPAKGQTAAAAPAAAPETPATPVLPPMSAPSSSTSTPTAAPGR